MTDATAFRIATFNLLHGQALDDGRVDEHRLTESVKALDADVLALQEVDRHQPRSGRADQAAMAAAEMGARWWNYVPTLYGTPSERISWVAARDGERREGPAYGTALISRLPVAHWRVLRFGAAPVSMPLLIPGRPGLTWWRDEPRAAVAAVVRGPAGLMTVISAHLSVVPGWSSFQLARVVSWAHRMPRPRFLLGDLNVPHPLPALTTGWHPLVRARTYPSYRPSVQFDHMLAHGCGDARMRLAAPRRMPISDHMALVAELNFGRALPDPLVVPAHEAALIDR